MIDDGFKKLLDDMEKDMDLAFRELNDYIFMPLSEQVGASQAGDCFHEWREYHGFSEQYRFCIKCDQRMS